MKSRYCYNHGVLMRVGRRLTVWERIRRDFRRSAKPVKPDIFPFGGYNAPIYPGK